MAFTCQELFDSAISVLSVTNKTLAVIVAKLDRISAKLGKLSAGLDLNALLARFTVPQLRLLTTSEYLDLILNCPVASCIMPMFLTIYNWLMSYIANVGPIDPNNPPIAVLNMVQSYVNLMNTQIRLQHAMACRAVNFLMNKSPLGKIGRIKGIFDMFVRLSGIFQIMQATDAALSCLLSKYPDAASNPDVRLYNAFKSQVNFDSQGNVKSMSDADQATMNAYESRKQELAGYMERLY